MKFAVIAHNIRSIMNVGSLFRSADGAGVDMLYLTGYTPGPDTHPEKISKTALGADSSVPWRRMRRAGDAIRQLKAQGVQVVALEQTKKSIDYRKFKPKWPLALMLGNEVTGIRNMS